jgi:DNA-binding IclR family transcriptional regulator
MHELLRFIRRSVRSVWALELLLLIRRPPLHAWSSAELVGELRASDSVVDQVLAGFESDGLVARVGEGRFRFAAEIARIDELCDALAEAYRERPHAIIQAITAPDENLAAFADAFRLKDRR